MKRFLVVSEQKRVKGQTSVSVSLISEGKEQTKQIVFFNYNNGSNRGIEHESIRNLVATSVLPEHHINENGYIDWSKKDY